jgi:hypothetical protein
MMDRADYSRWVAGVARIANKELACTIEGIWNPNFCAAEVSRDEATDFIEMVESYLDQIREGKGRLRGERVENESQEA